MTDLPAIHRAVALERVAPEGRRLDVGHPPRDDDAIALGVDLDGRLLNITLPDGSLVSVGFVGQVHQVIDHQSLVALDREVAAIEGPIRARAGPEVGNQSLVSLVGSADPYPHEAVPLGDRIGAGADAFVSPRGGDGHFDRLTLTVEYQPMVAAADVIAFLDAH